MGFMELKSSCWQDQFLLEATGDNLLPCLFKMPPGFLYSWPRLHLQASSLTSSSLSPALRLTLLPLSLQDVCDYTQGPPESSRTLSPSQTH